MTTTYTPPDSEFAIASGTNVNIHPDWSYFDHPPNSTANLTVTSNEGDTEPYLFETGDTYDITWTGHGGGVVEDAVVVRSDFLGSGDGEVGDPGVVVFEGINSNTGELVQVVWSPDFSLEDWYWSNGGGPSNPKSFWTSDQESESFQYVCFAAGTLIRTPQGERPIETLAEGDLVMTLDNGPQPICWIGHSRVTGLGPAAPIVLQPGAIGNDRRLVLSQQHRLLHRSPQAELYFGAHEVFLPAKALARSELVTIKPIPRITYFHLLLRRHEILFANGTLAESLFLGNVASAVLGGARMTQIRAKFGANLVGQTCRLDLHFQEARTLLRPRAPLRKAAA